MEGGRAVVRRGKIRAYVTMTEDTRRTNCSTGGGKEGDEMYRRWTNQLESKVQSDAIFLVAGHPLSAEMSKSMGRYTRSGIAISLRASAHSLVTQSSRDILYFSLRSITRRARMVNAECVYTMIFIQAVGGGRRRNTYPLYMTTLWSYPSSSPPIKPGSLTSGPKRCTRST